MDVLCVRGGNGLLHQKQELTRRDLSKVDKNRLKGSTRSAIFHYMLNGLLGLQDRKISRCAGLWRGAPPPCIPESGGAVLFLSAGGLLRRSPFLNDVFS